MKIVKRVLKFIAILIGILLISSVIVILVDQQSTSYLKTKNNKFANNTYLITNANIIPMNQDTILVNKMVFIKEGLIQNISDNIEMKGVEIIDAKNKYLTPGLIDMHVHVWDRYELGLYLSNGITSVRNLWGMPMHLRLKEDIENDKIIAPMFFTSDPKLTGPEFIGDDNLHLTSPLEAKEKVISYKKRGYDFIKTYYAERAKGGVGLIISGGIAPNVQGWTGPFSARMSTKKHARNHKVITDAVHKEGGKICMQILHAGRYGYHPLAVAPSAIKSPISPFKPFKLKQSGIKRTIRDFVNSAKLAKLAGYDGIEIMGSEGYLINQFISERTNTRTDNYGGSYENRMRLPIALVKQTREAVGTEFIIIYRLSMLDLVEKGSTWQEVVALGKEIEKSGATIINTGIGWHEARIPTIATSVPRAAFTWVTKKMKEELSIPLVTSNRINMPETAKKVLAEGHADMISMARPFLADSEWVNKAEANRSDEINTCIGCNQACLDHVFEQKVASCLVNPRACHETELNYLPTKIKKRIAVIGAGPAGLAAATIAAQRGHDVTLFDSEKETGGQFNMAKQIPGKEEFYETIRYFNKQIELHQVTVKLNTRVTSEDLKSGNFDEVILATGIKPRTLKIEGIDHPKVLDYIDVLKFKKPVGRRVAIIGAGGIGFDVSEYLAHEGESTSLNIDAWLKEWGIDKTMSARSGIECVTAEVNPSPREIFMFKRSEGKFGGNLGKTTGWIHRSTLKKKKVQFINSVQYTKIDDIGLHYIQNKEQKVLEVDNIIICAGQLPLKELLEPLEAEGIKVHVVGGADVAAELDAKLAINQACRLAATI